jgi:hypothetical protein
MWYPAVPIAALTNVDQALLNVAPFDGGTIAE